MASPQGRKTKTQLQHHLPLHSICTICITSHHAPSQKIWSSPHFEWRCTTLFLAKFCLLQMARQLGIWEGLRRDAKHVVLSWPLTCSWVPHLLLQLFPSLRFMRSFSGLDCKWNHFTKSPGTTHPNLYAVFGWRHVSGTFWKVSPGAISRTPSLFEVFSHLPAVIPDLLTFIPDVLALGLQPVTLKDLPALEIGWHEHHWAIMEFSLPFSQSKCTSLFVQMQRRHAWVTTSLQIQRIRFNSRYFEFANIPNFKP